MKKSSVVEQIAEVPKDRWTGSGKHLLCLAHPDNLSSAASAAGGASPCWASLQRGHAPALALVLANQLGSSRTSPG